MADKSHETKILGLAILPVRFVQGWIFWGGGSRRFIYDPSKLDPHSHEWMANKFQSGMPGAILGFDHIISFMVLHFDLLYTSIILFSLMELLSGLALMAGCFTRLAAFITVLISIVLMLTFGWQGATCMDEWTMAVATLAMGCTLTLAGAPAYSLDNVIARRYPSFAKKKWVRPMTSKPLKRSLYIHMVEILFVFTFLFTLLTYNYYRGSIFTPYHAGPVSAGKHHITLSNGVLKSDGKISLMMYVDGGTPALPSNIIRIELLNLRKQIIADWDGQMLSALSDKNIKNVYAYNRMHTGPYGLVVPMSAKATLMLMPAHPLKLSGNGYELVVFTINGGRYSMMLDVGA